MGNVVVKRVLRAPLMWEVTAYNDRGLMFHTFFAFSKEKAIETINHIYPGWPIAIYNET